MGFLAKFWPLLIVLILVIAGVAYLKSCKQGPSHAVDKKIVDSSEKAFQAFVAASQLTIHRLQQDSLNKQHQIDTLMAERIESENNLSLRGQIIGNTITEYQEAKVIHDTVLIVQTCDTLVQQVQEGRQAVAGYTKLTDTLLNEMIQQGKIKDSISLNWKLMFQHADTLAALQQTKYNSLYLDYVKQSGRLKFSGILSKGLAGAAVVILISALLKK